MDTLENLPKPERGHGAAMDFSKPKGEIRGFPEFPLTVGQLDWIIKAVAPMRRVSRLAVQLVSH